MVIKRAGGDAHFRFRKMQSLRRAAENLAVHQLGLFAQINAHRNMPRLNLRATAYMSLQQRQATVGT